jgi:hypothetical protein
MRKRTSDNGMAIIVTLFITLFLSIIAFGLISVSNVQLKTSANLNKSQQAYYAARNGLMKAISEIEEKMEKEQYGGSGVPKSETLGDDFKYTYEYVAAPTNDSSIYKSWRINVTGEYLDSTRHLEVWVEAMNFATFNLFVDKGPAITGGAWYLSTGTYLEGIVHNNEYFWVDGKPIATDRVTTSNRDDWRYNEALGTYRGTDDVHRKDRSKFYRARYSNYLNDVFVAASERFEFYGGAPVIPLPASVMPIKPYADKVYDSDVEIQFNSDGTATVRYFDEFGNSMTDTLSTTRLTLFSTRQVTKLEGDIKGSVTVSAQDDIYITGDLKYVDKSKDILGIIAEKNILIVTDKDTYKDLEINASLMALGKPDPLDPNLRIDGYFGVKGLQVQLVSDLNETEHGIFRGFLTIFGGQIYHQRAYVGRGLNSTTGIPRFGYKPAYIYDPKLRRVAPPNFPVFNRLRIVSVKDMGAI